MKLIYDTLQAPFGAIYIVMDEFGLLRVVMTPERWEDCRKEFGEIEHDSERSAEVITQLEEYFSGKRKEFTVSLSIKGTAFSEKVWQELRKIPFGETRSYADIAQALGNPKISRAVGQANRRNPLPIFIPCHRVIGKDGSMTGYIGEKHIPIKEYLLKMECSFL